MSAFSFELSHLFSAEGLLLVYDPRLSTKITFYETLLGLVVIVTGGGTGIGLMIATALENNGATVYIVGRRFERIILSAGWIETLYRKEIVEKAAKEHAVCIFRFSLEVEANERL